MDFTSSLSFGKCSTQTAINCGKIISVKYLVSKPVSLLSLCLSSLTYFSLSSFVSFSLVWWTLCRPPVDSRYLLITQYHSLPTPITNCSKFPPASVGLLLPGAFQLSFHPFSFLILSQRIWNCLCKEIWAQPLCPSPRVGRRYGVSITQYPAVHTARPQTLGRTAHLLILCKGPETSTETPWILTMGGSGASCRKSRGWEMPGGVAHCLVPA